MRWVLSFAVLFGISSPASADIFECRGAGGEKHYTNSSKGRRGCRRIVKSSKATRKSSRSSKRRPLTSNLKSVRDPSPERFVRYDQYIREAAALYRLPIPFVRAVVKVESNFSKGVVSHAGAMGLMQLMPQTARSMGVTDPFDPRQNILGGTRFLRILANKFNGDLVLTVAAYNAGQNAVLKYRGVPPYDETRRYVRRVLTHYYSYRKGRVL